MINFYLLKTTDIISSFSSLCKVINKALKEEQRILINTNNQQDTNMIDDALWSFQDESFLAHTSDINYLDDAKIFISNDSEIVHKFKIVINLSDTAILKKDIPKIVEFVYNNDEHKKLCRKKYNEYKNNNLEIFTYNIS